MEQLPRQQYTKEFREQTVQLVLREKRVREKRGHSTFLAQRRFVWVNSAHFRGKKAVRILSRMYSSSR